MLYRPSREFLCASIVRRFTTLVALLLTSITPSLASTSAPLAVAIGASDCGLELGPRATFRGPVEIRESWRSVVGKFANSTTDLDGMALEQIFVLRSGSTKEKFHEVDPDPALGVLATPLLATLTFEAGNATVHLTVGPMPQGCDVERVVGRPVDLAKEEFHEVDPDPSTLDGPAVDLWGASITWSTAEGSRLHLQIGFVAPAEGWNHGATDEVWQAFFERLGSIGPELSEASD